MCKKKEVRQMANTYPYSVRNYITGEILEGITKNAIRAEAQYWAEAYKGKLVTLADGVYEIREVRNDK
jgi:hypothetical protein